MGSHQETIPGHLQRLRRTWGLSPVPPTATAGTIAGRITRPGQPKGTEMLHAMIRAARRRTAMEAKARADAAVARESAL